MTRRKNLTVAHSLAKFSVLVLLVFSLIIYSLTLPVSHSAAPIEFEVKKGDSVTVVAKRLQSAGLIKSSLYFKLIVRTNNLVIQAGQYQISSSDTPQTIAISLTKGLAQDKKITIPEGYRLEQIALVASLPVKDFLVAAKGLEGQLFPDTYFIQADITSSALVKVMHDNYLQKVGSIDKETLILASLIERETKGDSEKSVVAGILKKRLSSGWALELDATVQYFLGKENNWWPNTTLLDRKIISPYNTYLNLGLPPGPICSPGLASIKAAQNPTDSAYWYYLHDRSGNIHYGKTLDEHNANIAKYITH